MLAGLSIVSQQWIVWQRVFCSGFSVSPFQKHLQVLFRKKSVHILRIKIEALNVPLVQVWWETFGWCCILFILKGVLTLISPLFSSPCWAGPAGPHRGVFSPLPPHLTTPVFSILSVVILVLDSPLPSLSSASLGTFSKILVLFYKSGTLSFMTFGPDLRTLWLLLRFLLSSVATSCDLSVCIHQSSGLAIFYLGTSHSHLVSTAPPHWLSHFCHLLEPLNSCSPETQIHAVTNGSLLFLLNQPLSWLLSWSSPELPLLRNLFGKPRRITWSPGIRSLSIFVLRLLLLHIHPVLSSSFKLSRLLLSHSIADAASVGYSVPRVFPFQSTLNVA